MHAKDLRPSSLYFVITSKFLLNSHKCNCNLWQPPALSWEQEAKSLVSQFLFLARTLSWEIGSQGLCSARSVAATLYPALLLTRVTSVMSLLMSPNFLPALIFFHGNNIGEISRLLECERLRGECFDIWYCWWIHIALVERRQANWK